MSAETAAPARTLIVPSWKDVRLFQAAFLFSFDLYALTSPGFHRSAAQFAAAILTCVLLDAFLLWRVRKVPLLPFSSLISGMGLTLLCDSPFLWPYFVLAVVTVLSKHLVRADGRHIFNPTNFALVFGIFFLSGEMTIEPGRWGGSTVAFAAVGAQGLLTVIRANRLDLSLTWVLTFPAGALVRWMLVPDARLLTLLAPMTGAAFMLFTFFMITDPMATPETRGGRIVFGVALGALDAALRHHHVLYAPWIALFAVSGAIPLFRAWWAPPVPERVWRPVEVSLPRR